MVHFNFQKKSLVFGFLFFVIFLFYVWTRLFLVNREGLAAFGYDTGIYRHTIAGYYERLHDKTVVPFGFSAFSNVLKVLGESTDDILIGWYIVVSLLVFFLFYYFVKISTNTPTALLAVFLFSLSTIQYEFYWWFYYRNFLALCLLLLALILLHFRSYVVILPLIAIGTIHVLTLIPLGLTLMLLVFFDAQNKKYYLQIGIAALGGVLLLNHKEFALYLPQLRQTSGQVSHLDAGQSELSGQFVDFSFFWKHSLLTFFFGIAGFVLYFKKFRSMALLLVVALLPIVFGILFYRRYFVLIDLCLIFFAAVMLSYILQSQKKWYVYLSFCFFAGIGMFLSGQYVLVKQPLITHFDLEEIISLNTIPPAHVMALSSAIAPWLYGFTHHSIIAPGVFEENKWNLPQWQTFWMTADPKVRSELLSQYELPLYIYVSPFEEGFRGVLSNDSHFVSKADSLWQYIP